MRLREHMTVLMVTPNALGTALAITLSLYLWRVFYPMTDWAVLALMPLMALLFTGSMRTSLAVYRAIIKAAVWGDSKLLRLMTGGLRAIFGATVFLLVAVPLLAFHAISSTYPEFLLIAFLCFVAAVLFAGAERTLLQHLTPPFARSVALSVAVVIAVVLFIPVLAWVNWNFTPQPGEIQDANLQEALMLGIDQLPKRRGWVAELLTPFYALVYGKLWLAVQREAPRWLLVWYSVDAALVSFVAARASAVLMSLVQITRGRNNNAF